ncbi:MAG: hypothetical protein WCJ40_03845 [Planctomycetota bacterium]|jgi:hypothetical protein|nr:hypothetical protein [Planctomycetota bacterium]RLT08953.1 MAG: hypothetical protein DWI24_10295 [Planctomycetota bacterium]
MENQSTNQRIPVKIHRNVCLIRCADASTALEITSRKNLSEHILGHLDERTILVRHDRLQIVLEELQKSDLHPRLV